VCPAVPEGFEWLAFLIVERHKGLFLEHRWSSPVPRLTRLYPMPGSSIKFAVMEY